VRYASAARTLCCALRRTLHIGWRDGCAAIHAWDGRRIVLLYARHCMMPCSWPRSLRRLGCGRSSMQRWPRSQRYRRRRVLAVGLSLTAIDPSSRPLPSASSVLVVLHRRRPRTAHRTGRQRATGSVRHATHLSAMQRIAATCHRQDATCKLRHATYEMQHSQ
jgi:hypothetical protein